VLTEGEKAAIGRRILVAQMVLSGHTYFEINERIHISPNTHSLVRKWLKGQIPEYAAVLNKHRQEEKDRAEKKKLKYVNKNRVGFSALRKKYPMHFLLVNIVDDVFNSPRERK